jgi:hypothetical protein
VYALAASRFFLRHWEQVSVCVCVFLCVSVFVRESLSVSICVSVHCHCLSISTSVSVGVSGTASASTSVCVSASGIFNSLHLCPPPPPPPPPLSTGIVTGTFRTHVSVLDIFSYVLECDIQCCYFAFLLDQLFRCSSCSRPWTVYTCVCMYVCVGGCVCACVSVCSVCFCLFLSVSVSVSVSVACCSLSLSPLRVPLCAQCDALCIFNLSCSGGKKCGKISRAKYRAGFLNSDPSKQQQQQQEKEALPHTHPHNLARACSFITLSQILPRTIACRNIARGLWQTTVACMPRIQMQYPPPYPQPTAIVRQKGVHACHLVRIRECWSRILPRTNSSRNFAPN